MWLKIQMLILCYFAIVGGRKEQIVSRSNFLLTDYPGEDSSTFARGRPKRTLFRGGYCRLRGCCPGRDDSCHFQYNARNATCYCDTFCTSGSPASIDCCPDFWVTCYGHHTRQPAHLRPLPLQQGGCSKDGRHYGDGATFKDNCNSCKCINSHWICSDETCLVRPSLIKQINSGSYGWEASNYSQFWGMSLQEGFRYRLGTLPPSAALLDMTPIAGNFMRETDFPEHFVAWHEWPGQIHDPLDQRNCAASWAFSTASVAADRMAIHSEGRFTDNLSPQNLISCDARNQNGCKGGSLDGAWSYLKNYGLVSHACYPLFWSHHSQSTCAISSIIDTDGKRRATRPCPNNVEPSNRLYQCHSPYRISSWETNIMEEIKENGPVQAVMQVHHDFFLYKSGIYQCGRNAGGPADGHQSKTHSVKIVGWGVLRDAEEQRKKYWIVANSWGKAWGENGYFKILRGQNECDIENLIIATKCDF